MELQNLGNTTYIVHGFASGISVDRDIASDYLYLIAIRPHTLGYAVFFCVLGVKRDTPPLESLRDGRVYVSHQRCKTT